MPGHQLEDKQKVNPAGQKSESPFLAQFGGLCTTVHRGSIIYIVLSFFHSIRCNGIPLHTLHTPEERTHGLRGSGVQHIKVVIQLKQIAKWLNIKRI